MTQENGEDFEASLRYLREQAALFKADPEWRDKTEEMFRDSY